MKAYTDYPIVELGDIAGKEAPIRHCVIVSYDGDKRCKIVIGSSLVETELKSGYLYKQEGRLGDVPCVDVSELPRQLFIKS